MLSLIWTYRYEPLLELPPEWLFPVQQIVAFPTGVPGNFQCNRAVFHENLNFRRYSQNMYF